MQHDDDLRERIVHLDPHLVVVDKPAGMQTVRHDEDAGRSDDVPLDEAVARLVSGRTRPAPLFVVHRLDRETSGLIVFARRGEAARALEHQLRRRRTHRRYLALATGNVRSGTFRSFLAEDRGDGRRGSTRHARFGKEAVTHVRAIEQFRSVTLVECRLETGRTHQIRIHLAEAGHPLVGEPRYGRTPSGARSLAPRLMLHAVELGFVHPASEAPMRFAAALPADFAACLAAAGK